MKVTRINANNAPQPAGRYSQALEVKETSRRLYISGQIPVTASGDVPETFAEQARQTWANVIAQLNAADMTVANLVKVTTFLSDRRYIQENRDVRTAVLGNHEPALSVVLAGIFDEAWLLEIEAIAEA